MTAAASSALNLRQRLTHLPRDTRDTLFHLAVIGWTIAPHLLHLPLWCGAMALVLLAWRARLALTAGALPGRWLVTALLVLAAGLTLWSERTLLGKEAGITMLVVLMSLKTLELRARRDALVVLFLGFFLVLTHFLYSQSLGTGLWLLVAVWGLLTALVLAHMPVGRPPLMRAGWVAARAAALGLPLMAVLFVLFPRIGPLWGLPQDAAGRTGLSGSLRMGGVATLAEDDSIAFRVRFTGATPSPAQMYWRGPVLSNFDGREWTRLASTFPVALRPRLELELRGAPLRYEMTLEPSRLPLLPMLEMTPDDEASAPRVAGWLLTLRPDGQWQVDRPLSERLRVQAAAFTWDRKRWEILDPAIEPDLGAAAVHPAAKAQVDQVGRGRGIDKDRPKHLRPAVAQRIHADQVGVGVHPRAVLEPRVRPAEPAVGELGRGHGRTVVEGEPKGFDEETIAGDMMALGYVLRGGSEKETDGLPAPRGLRVSDLPRQLHRHRWSCQQRQQRRD